MKLVLSLSVTTANVLCQKSAQSSSLTENRAASAHTAAASLQRVSTLIRQQQYQPKQVLSVIEFAQPPRNVQGVKAQLCRSLATWIKVSDDVWVLSMEKRLLCVHSPCCPWQK
jgi:hypothetical protein